MLRFTCLIIALFGTSLVASASDLDAMSANLQSHGFACEAPKEIFRNCGISGKRPDGKPYEIHVFAVKVNEKTTELTIFVQPAEAANSAEVGGIYDKLGQSFAYDKGKLKDRFPDMKSVTDWCDDKGIHNPGRCTIVEPVEDKGQADFSVSSGLNNVDQWSLGWTTSRSQ
jgi:hypothetical protein